MIVLGALQDLGRMTLHGFGSLPTIIQTAIGVGILLLLRMFLLFTILPKFAPDEPLVYPYWVPGLGHLFSFFGNSDALLARARLYFGNTREPFAICVPGGKIYVLTKAADVAEAYRNIQTLSFNVFVQKMIKTMGTTPRGIEAMYEPLPASKPGFPNPKGKPLGTLARDMHIHQLFPGMMLSDLGEEFNKWFDCQLHRKGILQKCPYVKPSAEDDSITVPLMTWCSDYVTRAGQEAYFGPLLEQIDPTMGWTFLQFDELSYQILFQYPPWLCKKLFKARDKLIDDFVAYFDTPQSQRHGDAWFVKAMENEMRSVGLSTRDMSSLMVTVYWGINTNTRKAAYWILSFILSDAALYQKILEEIAPAFEKDVNTPNAHYLLDQCPRLNAAWDETVRMSAFSASVRHVTEDTWIGGKLLRKGNRLMIPYRQLHFDESVFGADIESFKADRFLNDSSLTRSGHWRPFGGGTTQCPGRFAAKQVVLCFVAMLFKRFHVQLEGHQEVPKGKLGQPVLGLMSSLGEMQVRLTPRIS